MLDGFLEIVGKIIPALGITRALSKKIIQNPLEYSLLIVWIMLIVVLGLGIKRLSERGRG